MGSRRSGTAIQSQTPSCIVCIRRKKELVHTTMAYRLWRLIYPTLQLQKLVRIPNTLNKLSIKFLRYTLFFPIPSFENTYDYCY